MTETEFAALRQLDDEWRYPHAIANRIVGAGGPRYDSADMHAALWRLSRHGFALRAFGKYAIAIAGIDALTSGLNPPVILAPA